MNDNIPNNKGKPSNAGRKPIFKSASELKELIEKYFEDCDTRDRPPTIAGLAYWLEIDRQTVYNYEKKDEFFGTIKRARDRIIMNIEEELFVKGNAGQIFLAKNYGYTDKMEVESNNTNHNYNYEAELSDLVK